jgi:hypothetical protein
LTDQWLDYCQHIVDIPVNDTDLNNFFRGRCPDPDDDKHKQKWQQTDKSVLPP